MSEIRRVTPIRRPRPTPVVAVVAIMAGIGVYLGQRVARSFPDLVELALRSDGQFRELVVRALANNVAVLGVAGACTALALGVWQARPQVRILTFVTAALIAVTYFSDDPPMTLEMATMLGSLVVMALLGLSDSVRTWLGRGGTRFPVVVLAARTLAMVLGPFLAARGVILLFAGPLGSEHYAMGGALIAGGATALVNAPRLLTGEAAARTTLSVGMVVVIVAELWLTRGYFLYPGGFAAALLALMWIPEDAQLHYR